MVIHDLDDLETPVFLGVVWCSKNMRVVRSNALLKPRVVPSRKANFAPWNPTVKSESHLKGPD